MTMPALDALPTSCPSCGKQYLRARAFAAGAMEFLDGEPAGSIAWTGDALDELPSRVYRIECTECGHAVFERDDCPRCQAPGGVARALSGRHGIAPPSACPTCGLGDLTLTVVARMHAVVTLGKIARRVLDAEPHDAGFHILQAHGADCDGVVVSVPEIQCGVCGRSSLLRKRS
jgi:hypothetical protein